MASRRNLKKVVNDLCLGVINECFVFLEHTPSLNQENVREIINEAVNLRNRLIYNINHPQPGNSTGSGLKGWYRSVAGDLDKGRTRLIERLNSLPR